MLVLVLIRCIRCYHFAIEDFWFSSVFTNGMQAIVVSFIICP